MYDTVIFEYEGTLCQRGCLASALAKISESRQAYQIGQLIERYLADFSRVGSTSQPDWQLIWQVAFATYGQSFDEQLGIEHLQRFVADNQLYDYTLPLLEVLQDQGLKTVLLANVVGCSEVYQQDLDKRGLTAHFDRVIWSSDIGYRKPNKQAFQIALNSTGSHSSSTLFVSDKELTDIWGASSLGMATMLVTDQYQVSRFADYVALKTNLMDEIKQATRFTKMIND